MRQTAKGLEYPNRFYWNYLVNPNATIENGLANCTTYCYGAIKEDGHAAPVSSIVNANRWDQVLTNGWMAVPYEEGKAETGDIIQWVDKCHVAVVSKKDTISGSYYTGMHGKAYYDGKFDTRDFSSLEEMCNWMIVNYPTRFFHCWSIETECEWVGGEPNNILKHPLYSVERNEAVDQIEVLTYQQNVRNNDNEILKKAERGFFNVLNQKIANGYLWYEVEKNKWIAQVDGRVVFYERKDDDIAELRKENKELKARVKVLEDKLDAIRELSVYAEDSI